MNKFILLLLLLIFSVQSYGQVQNVLCDAMPRNRDKESGKEYYFTHTDLIQNVEISDRIRNSISYKGLTRDSIDTSMGDKTTIYLFISEEGVVEKWFFGRKSWVNECSVFEKQVVPQIKKIPFQTVECNSKRVPYMLTLTLSFNLRHIYSYLDEDNKTTTSD